MRVVFIPPVIDRSHAFCSLFGRLVLIFVWCGPNRPSVFNSWSDSLYLPQDAAIYSRWRASRLLIIDVLEMWVSAKPLPHTRMLRCFLFLLPPVHLQHDCLWQRWQRDIFWWRCILHLGETLPASYGLWKWPLFVAGLAEEWFGDWSSCLIFLLLYVIGGSRWSSGIFLLTLSCWTASEEIIPSIYFRRPWSDPQRQRLPSSHERHCEAQYTSWSSVTRFLM